MDIFKKIAGTILIKMLDDEIITDKQFPKLLVNVTKFLFASSLLISFIFLGVILGDVWLYLKTALFVNIWLSLENKYHASKNQNCFVISTFIVTFSYLVNYNLVVRFANFWLAEWFVIIPITWAIVKVVLSDKFIMIMDFIDKKVLK